ncbi:hypothetical protein KY284_001511 [Solanum tuberosum]|nr:hypothetical protein KY284_001511 [Solanum tuberosum]
MERWLPHSEVFKFTFVQLTVTLDRAVLIAAIMDDMGIDVGRLIVDQIFELTPGRAKSIIFPSLITRFFYEAGVVKHPTDE